MRHDGELVQRGLTVEQAHIPVLEVSFNNVPMLELCSHERSVSISQEDLAAIGVLDDVCAGVHIRPVENGSPQLSDVVRMHALGVGERLGNQHGHANLVHGEVRVR